METILDSRPFAFTRPLVYFVETGKHLVDEVQTPLPLIAGHPWRYDTEYERLGTATSTLSPTR